MPLIDLAEAVSRGEIIVDEVDALNKYAQRFIADRNQPSQNQRLFLNLFTFLSVGK